MAKSVRKAPAKKAQSNKSAPKKAAKPQAKVVSHADFMKRLLAKKEADRIAKQEQNQNSKFNMHKMETQTNSAAEAHNRFAGPRRKAAV